jgi:hypothetical protein
MELSFEGEYLSEKTSSTLFGMSVSSVPALCDGCEKLCENSYLSLTSANHANRAIDLGGDNGHKVMPEDGG